MTDLLRDELHRIGDTAPEVSVPADTWARGRRARLRDRVVTAGVVVAVLALVGGVAWVGVLRPRLAPPVDGSSAPGVPSTIHTVPYRVLDKMDPDVRVGLTAAAFATERGDVITVSASDGSHHRLRLSRLLDDDWRMSKAMTDDGSWAVLSPDGRMLAYAWEVPADGSPVPTGVSILDLTTGQERSVTDLHGGAGVWAMDLTWSPDGRWLAWSGLVTKSWQASRRSYGDAAFGLIDVRGGDSVQATMKQGRFDGVLVGDDGLLRLLGAGKSTKTPPWAEPIPGSTAGAGAAGSAIAPGAESMLLGSNGAPVSSLTFLTDHQRAVVQVAPPHSGADHLSVRALGWIDATHAVAEVVYLTDNEPPGGYTWDGRRLVLVTLDRDERSARDIGQILADDSSPTVINLSIATDLMTLDRPTVERPEPDWPWSPERRWAVWGGSAALLVAAVLLVRGLARRRRLPGLPDVMRSGGPDDRPV
ncbi:MAG: hypothetical protein U0R80_14410 [Nocardioidaceae bacterium]